MAAPVRHRGFGRAVSHLSKSQCDAVYQSRHAHIRPNARRASGLFKSWDESGFGVWALTVKPEGRLAGFGGFVTCATLGYIIDEPFWGRGDATEAAQACLEYGFLRLNYGAISAGALKHNLGSLKVIQKLGMRPAHNEIFGNNGGVFFTLTREEWEQQKKSR